MCPTVSVDAGETAGQRVRALPCSGGLWFTRWAEAHEKIARMTLTIKLDRNWSSFQLANSAPPLSVTDSAIAPSARMLRFAAEVQLDVRFSERLCPQRAPLGF